MYSRRWEGFTFDKSLTIRHQNNFFLFQKFKVDTWWSSSTGLLSLTPPTSLTPVSISRANPWNHGAGTDAGKYHLIHRSAWASADVVSGAPSVPGLGWSCQVEALLGHFNAGGVKLPAVNHCGGKGWGWCGSLRSAKALIFVPKERIYELETLVNWPKQAQTAPRTHPPLPLTLPILLQGPYCSNHEKDFIGLKHRNHLPLSKCDSHKTSSSSSSKHLLHRGSKLRRCRRLLRASALLTSRRPCTDGQIGFSSTIAVNWSWRRSGIGVGREVGSSPASLCISLVQCCQPLKRKITEPATMLYTNFSPRAPSPAFSLAPTVFASHICLCNCY